MRCALFYRTEKLAVEGETPVSLRFARKSPLSLGLLDMGLASLASKIKIIRLFAFVRTYL